MAVWTEFVHILKSGTFLKPKYVFYVEKLSSDPLKKQFFRNLSNFLFVFS